MTTYKLPDGVTVSTSARAVRVTADEEMLHCQLEDGRIVAVPIDWYPRLAAADNGQRNNLVILGGGRLIHWPDLDEDLAVRNFLAGCTAEAEAEGAVTLRPNVGYRNVLESSSRHESPQQYGEPEGARVVLSANIAALVR